MLVQVSVQKTGFTERGEATIPDQQTAEESGRCSLLLIPNKAQLFKVMPQVLHPVKNTEDLPQGMILPWNVELHSYN